MRRKSAGPARSTADLHRAWLELVDADGPFLSVPALKRVWQQGMPQLGADQAALLKDAKPAFEKAWEGWDLRRDDPSALDRYREARDAWVKLILRNVLGWGDHYTTDLTGALFADAADGVRSPNYAVTVTPTGALAYGETIGALVLVVDPVDSLRDPLDDGWATSPIDRMEELLRHGKVPIGVVTDGRWWAVVSARKDTMVASGVVDAQTWIEEPQTRDAFVELLRLRRLLGGRPEDRLTELFGESVAAAEEITEALGVQVRRAVELLVQALSEAGLDAVRHGEPDPLPADREEVYEAAVTVMMRVVFLLFAEERGLLPQSRLFAMGYGISDELDALDRREREEGGETLDGTHLTWHRLLATSQALSRGASFEDLRLPSYGGSLFDPDRFPFLTARSPRDTLAITVSDRVMLEVLRAVQMAQLRGEPARRISFRDIDVEQIGYIYEGLLGYSSQETKEVTIGLIGKAGEEPEMPLAELEAMAARYHDPAKLADAILAWAKDDQPAAKLPSKAALAKAIRGSTEVEDAERALRAVTTDEALRDRLRPLIGIIRRDLRNRPFVVEPGGVLLVETPSRATAGAHYTPRKLAEEVVKYALEPLVFNPGPHQTGDPDAWRPLSSDDILDIRVADIACGSGAFLVAAARFLAARLVEAWRREGVATGSAHDLYVHAIRTVVARCLYGADINAMAVEMCKLSLWLVSLDPKLPFSFVDDKVLHGNSLLGLTDAEQLRALHITPAKAAATPLFDLGDGAQAIRHLDIDGVLTRAARLRRSLASEVSDNDPQRSAATKRRQWREYQELTHQLADVADGVIAAGLQLGGKPGRALSEAYENLRVAVGRAYPADADEPNKAMLDGILTAGLTPTVKTDYERWKPLHWILAVPDVMERGGFDAIIGNPPFLGGPKLTGAMGTNVRDWFVTILASGRRGTADGVAYFFLRAMQLLTRKGNIGLIATNSIAQGATREVGLDRMVADGFCITRSIQSRTWPAAGANLQYAAVWGTRGTVAPGAPRVSDGVGTERISTLLEPAGRIDGIPIQLAENSGIAFIGCYALGMGFVIDPEEAADWIDVDSKNAEVLFPYLNGEDLNSRPDASPSRWIIDFNGHLEMQAKRYELPYGRLAERVKPERAKKAKAVREAPWWLFLRSRPAMRKAIADLNEFLVMTRHSVTVMPYRISKGLIPSEATVVFATDSFVDQAVLSSSLHQMWAIKYGSGLRNDPRYTPSGVFATFPRPKTNNRLAEIGKELHTERHEIMLRRDLGLTKLYHLVNDQEIADSFDRDVARLRQLHVALDEAVMDAYGWGDVPLEHGFHTYRQMQRWTVSPGARVEILDRLLEENHRRAAVQGEASAPIDADEEIEGEDE
ncbi:Eco57I restriction-modification methylase domain-containing protein [Streptomyces rubellomurinus]|uniref:site-specific DNA-methyltransferase (adenine-specific) n=1 Tax=Streptomyces rubellomurinus (strain ATCC 31215) TaxID=359131 RepID=A0A0F2TCF0_STRR3|nr:DNA methyltransferase [Streptomyces rubellomurinus]KJS60888.1 Type II restriction enzyme, methylase subunit [Streptomyces rubellomurinus]